MWRFQQDPSRRDGDLGRRLCRKSQQHNQKRKLFRRNLCSGQRVVPKHQLHTPDGPIERYSSSSRPCQRKWALTLHTRSSRFHHCSYSHPHPSPPQTSPLSLLHHFFPLARPDAKPGPWSSSPQSLIIPPTRPSGGLLISLFENSCSCYPGACHHFLGA